MDFDDFLDGAQENLWQSAADYFAASLPKPPGTAAAVPQNTQAGIIFQALPASVGGFDQKTILIAGGVLVGSLVLVMVLSRAKKGKR